MKFSGLERVVIDWRELELFAGYATSGLICVSQLNVQLISTVKTANLNSNMRTTSLVLR